jgi:hypothetical protein
MTAAFLIASLLAAADAAPAGPPPPPPAAPAPPPRPISQPPVQTPFRLSLTYTRVLSEDGELTNDALTTNAIGIDMAFPSGSYVRNHLGLANQWESGPGGYSARGARIDLVSLGYPIELVRGVVRFDLEPILDVVRGEIMFVDHGPTVLRLEAGFGLDLSVTALHWFLSAEPAVDFRYLMHASGHTQTGFGRLFPLRVALGHEF